MATHHSTIRKVHAWASLQRGEVTVHQCMNALQLAKSTVNNALTALEAAGFATRRSAPRVKTQPTAYWTVTGLQDKIHAIFSEGLLAEQRRNRETLIEQCPSVWAYGDRCRQAYATTTDQGQ